LVALQQAAAGDIGGEAFDRYTRLDLADIAFVAASTRRGGWFRAIAG
jgi:hypothetical protein